MKMIALALLAATVAAPALAVDAPTVTSQTIAVKRGAILRTADGRRLGRIDEVQKDKSGTPTRVQLIFNSKVIYVPVSTISDGGNGAVTSLSYEAVKSL